MVPDGTISDVHYIVIVQKDAYTQLEEPRKKALARLIGRINQHLAGETYILIGPGRWGSVNPALGIPVTYSDIYHSRALIEMVEVESAIEPSYGTHFFQDLVEAQIFILPLALDHPDTELNEAFLDDAENLLGELLPQDEEWSPILKVIDVPANAAGQTLNLVMDGDAGLAMAWLSTRTDAPTA
jgi:hypothetical protein